MEREARTRVLDLVRRLSETALGPHVVLGGSTGLYGVSDRLLAMTEDTDLLIDERWLARNEEVVLSALGALGFQHQAGTCTFVSEGGASLDLVGYAEGDPTDRIGGVVPHVFLRIGSCALAPLRRDGAEVRVRLRARAVWTLDTASRLRWGIGLVRSGDLHGYLSRPDLAWAEREGLVGPATEAGLCLDPPYPRDPVLLCHLSDTPPPTEIVAEGERVVETDRLIRDLFGAFGFRPDLLARFG